MSGYECRTCGNYYATKRAMLRVRTSLPCCAESLALDGVITLRRLRQYWRGRARWKAGEARSVLHFDPFNPSHNPEYEQLVFLRDADAAKDRAEEIYDAECILDGMPPASARWQESRDLANQIREVGI